MTVGYTYIPMSPATLGAYAVEAADFADERKIETYSIFRDEMGDWTVSFHMEDGHGPFQVDVQIRQPLKEWHGVMNQAIAKIRHQRVKTYGPLAGEINGVALDH